MLKTVRWAALAALLASPLLAQASDRACLLEGSFTLMGKTVPIKDCMLNQGMPAAQFVQNGQGVSRSAAALGAQPAKITYLAACPAAARGSCESLFGEPLTGYYYARDAQALKDTEASCRAGGCTWKRG
jgi:hypothetical protein